MLSWDEEVKPSPQTSFARTPQADALSLQEVSASAVRTLNDGARVPNPALFSEAVATPQATARRVRASDKRIINGQTDVNQLVPFKYK